MGMGLLFDATRCIGCGACSSACKEQNKLPGKVEEVLTAYTWTTVQEREGLNVRRLCMHCEVPTCASVCPVGALKKTPEGPVVYDAERCMGCRYCMMACPFGIPRYAWGSAVPYVRKCTMCYENRVKDGRQPACTEACPTQATIFGEREPLLAEAHKRIRETPEKYKPVVWGETDAGGTGVLYVSPIPLDFLNVGRSVEGQALPRLTSRAMEAVPPVFVGMGAIMGGVRWIIGRRMKLEGGEGADGTSAHGSHDGSHPGSAGARPPPESSKEKKP